MEGSEKWNGPNAYFLIRIQEQICRIHPSVLTLTEKHVRALYCDQYPVDEWVPAVNKGQPLLFNKLSQPNMLVLDNSRNNT